MPRAPKPCKKKGKGEAEADPPLAQMVDSVAQGCRAFEGQKQGSKLPLEAIQKLSQEISEAKWQGRAAELPELAVFDELLPGIFKALERRCIGVADVKSRGKESQRRLENGGAGLLLAVLVLDLSAFEGKRHQLCELTLANAMSFLWQQARFVLPTLLECKATEVSSTCSGLARALRSLHHILARSGNALVAGLGHKAVAMAAQCLTVASTPTAATKTALSSLGDAAMELLAGSGSAPALQDAALQELARLAGVPALLRSLEGPSFLALALRFVAPQQALKGPPKEPTTTRCNQLVAMLVQHALLERQDLSQLVAHLSSACGDLSWPTAPLIASRLLPALSRVASASRNVDLECAQREEATKLIAQMAEERLGSCLLASDCRKAS